MSYDEQITHDIRERTQGVVQRLYAARTSVPNPILRQQIELDVQMGVQVALRVIAESGLLVPLSPAAAAQQKSFLDQNAPEPELALA